MLISKKEEKDKDILQFISCHGMAEKGDYYNYHMSLGFYYAYSIDAFRYAEIIENGEVFDEDKVSIVIRNLYVAYGKKENAVQTAKKWLQRFLKHGMYERSPDGSRKGPVPQDFFLYEVAVYILYLAGEEVDYGFLMQHG